MKNYYYLLSTFLMLFTIQVQAKSNHDDMVGDSIISNQRLELSKNTEGKGFGPQSPRNIDVVFGGNIRMFSRSPASSEMNLCNLHFHKNAEHAGGQFTKYAGNGDGHGYRSGYKYSGTLSNGESKPVNRDICPSKHGGLQSGDTIEVHYVYSTAQVTPGVTLNACFNDSIKNPQLRVKAQVFVLVNDDNALNFMKLTQVDKKDNFYQALSAVKDMGPPVIYEGSTTGPGYNTSGSPYQVTWDVSTSVAKVNIDTVGEWCKGNVFKEDHAHGVRNLVVNPGLLSPIK